MITIPITKSARRWGYIIWPPKLDVSVRDLIQKKDKVHVYLNDSDLGEKKINWKYSRISVGYKVTSRFSENASQYVLTYDNTKGILRIKTK